MQDPDAFVGWDALTVFIVAEGNNIAKNGDIIGKNGGGTEGWRFGKETGSDTRWVLRGTTGNEVQTFTYGINVKRVWSLVYGGGIRKSHGDGSEKESYTDSGTIATAPLSPLSIGGRSTIDGSPANFAQAMISEVLVYKRALPDDERRKIEGYLAHKWGLDGNLDVSHPFKSTAPDFSDPAAGVEDNMI